MTDRFSGETADVVAFTDPVHFWDHYDELTSEERATWRERWPNFPPAELACRGSGQLMIRPAVVDRLQTLRDALDGPVTVTSAYRTERHNRAIGGAPDSLHLDARAYDIVIGSRDPRDVEATAVAVGFTGIGRYPDRGFVHVDTGPRRTWGTPWPDRGAVPFPRPPPAPKPLAESRTIKTASGGAAVAGAGVVAGVADQLDVALPVVGRLSRLVEAAPATALIAGGLFALAVIGAIVWYRIDDHAAGRR